MLKCRLCKMEAKDIYEYACASEFEGLSMDEYLEEFEPTYRKSDDSFICTDCYIEIGQPATEDFDLF